LPVEDDESTGLTDTPGSGASAVAGTVT